MKIFQFIETVGIDYVNVTTKDLRIWCIKHFDDVLMLVRPKHAVTTRLLAMQEKQLERAFEDLCALLAPYRISMSEPPAHMNKAFVSFEAALSGRVFRSNRIFNLIYERLWNRPP